MAFNEGTNFERVLDSASDGGRSTALMSLGKIFDTISAPPDSPGKHSHLCQNNRESEGEIFVARNVEKRVFLDIDLNVAPPEDECSESPPAGNGGNGLETRPPAVAVVADEHGLIFNGTTEVVDEICCAGIRNGIEAHWSKGEINGLAVVEEEAKPIETANLATDSDGEREERESRNRRWNALLEVSENSSREREECLRNKAEKLHNWKRGTCREAELGGDSPKATVGKSITGKRRRSFTYCEVAPPQKLVVRSTRGRAVAMSNKYRDSVLDAVAAVEAEFPRHCKSSKSATAAVSNKRKSR